MSNEHFFITGAMGCIGAWVVRNLIRDGADITVFDLSRNKHRLELIMEPAEIAEIHFVHDDITKTDNVVNVVEASKATHIIHLAALQVPFCKANPVLGAAVNVMGTVNMFEAAKHVGLKQLVYASSLAVYGPKEFYTERYGDGLLNDQSPYHPMTHYGVYKQANEGTARVYWHDDGIASLALKPYTIYGPARDQGMTSTPTRAMLAAAAGKEYRITFGGYSGMQYVDDVAKTFIRLARTPFEGATSYNIQGSIVHMQAVVDAIVAAEPSAEGKITFDEQTLPFPKGQDETALQALLGDVPTTPLADGVAQTIDHFKQALVDERIAWEM